MKATKRAVSMLAAGVLTASGWGLVTAPPASASAAEVDYWSADSQLRGTAYFESGSLRQLSRGRNQGLRLAGRRLRDRSAARHRRRDRAWPLSRRSNGQHLGTRCRQLRLLHCLEDGQHRRGNVRRPSRLQSDGSNLVLWTAHPADRVAALLIRHVSLRRRHGASFPNVLRELPPSECVALEEGVAHDESELTAAPQSNRLGNGAPRASCTCSSSAPSSSDRRSSGQARGRLLRRPQRRALLH